MPTEVVEDRLNAIERELAEMKTELARISVANGVIHRDWLDVMEGSMAEFPEFDDMVRLGKEFRKSHHPPEDNY